MGFWDKVGGAAKWITDPKQLLTAAGFVFGGGPVGAGVGRAIGGMVPQNAGPVPWGALGADTSEFRESTLADGLDWGDVGTAGKDFASGYTAGTIGQQVPGIKNLEGDALIRAFGGGQQAVQGMGVEAGMSSVGAPPGAGVVPGGGFGSMSPEMGEQFPNVARFAGGGMPQMAQGAQAGAPDSMARAFAGGGQQGARGVGLDPETARHGVFGDIPSVGSSAQRAGTRGLIGNAVQKGSDFWGSMSGMEKIMAMNALANFGSGLASGPEEIGPAPSGWGPQPRYAIPSFSDWRSRRG
jgi:hypothetical protein